MFYNGLNLEVKMLLDAAARGTMMVVGAYQVTIIKISLSSTNRQAHHNKKITWNKGEFRM